jgi:hypothetical protein
LVESAAAVLAAPPSVLKEFMEGLGIDPEILGKTPMPSTHANPPSAKLLIAQEKAERDKLAAPKITPAQAALDAAEENVAAADHDENEARKAVNRYRSRLRNAKKELEAGTGTAEAVAEQQKLLDEAKDAHVDAQRRQAESRDDLAAAKFGMREDMSSDEERDAYYASLTDDEVAAITRSYNRKYAAEARCGCTPVVVKRSRNSRSAEFNVTGRFFCEGMTTVLTGRGDGEVCRPLP